MAEQRAASRIESIIAEVLADAREAVAALDRLAAIGVISRYEGASSGGGYVTWSYTHVDYAYSGGTRTWKREGKSIARADYGATEMEPDAISGTREANRRWGCDHEDLRSFAFADELAAPARFVAALIERHRANLRGVVSAAPAATTAPAGAAEESKTRRSNKGAIGTSKGTGTLL